MQIFENCRMLAMASRIHQILIVPISNLEHLAQQLLKLQIVDISIQKLESQLVCSMTHTSANI